MTMPQATTQATDLRALERDVERLSATPAGTPLPGEAEAVVERLLAALERGEARAAVRGDDGAWRAVPWVKRGILLGFRAGAVVDMSPGEDSPFRFLDKHTYPTQRIALDRGVRIVPGGSTVRRGAHLARGVVCMPPMYVPRRMLDPPGTMRTCCSSRSVRGGTVFLS